MNGNGIDQAFMTAALYLSAAGADGSPSGADASDKDIRFNRKKDSLAAAVKEDPFAPTRHLAMERTSTTGQDGSRNNGNNLSSIMNNWAENGGADCTVNGARNSDRSMYFDSLDSSINDFQSSQSAAASYYTSLNTDNTTAAVQMIQAVDQSHASNSNTYTGQPFSSFQDHHLFPTALKNPLSPTNQQNNSLMTADSLAVQSHAAAMAPSSSSSSRRILQQIPPPPRNDHATDRKFCCPVCDREFSTLHLLKSHQLTHESSRPFACVNCPQKFSRKHDLTRHMKTHSEQKPFVCEWCGRQFSRRDALKRHENMKINHPQYCSSSKATNNNTDPKATNSSTSFKRKGNTQASSHCINVSSSTPFNHISSHVVAATPSSSSANAPPSLSARAEMEMMLMQQQQQLELNLCDPWVRSAMGLLDYGNEEISTGVNGATSASSIATASLSSSLKPPTTDDLSGYMTHTEAVEAVASSIASSIAAAAAARH